MRNVGATMCRRVFFRLYSFRAIVNINDGVTFNRVSKFNFRFSLVLSEPVE